MSLFTPGINLLSLMTTSFTRLRAGQRESWTFTAETANQSCLVYRHGTIQTFKSYVLLKDVCKLTEGQTKEATSGVYAFI